MPTPWQKQTVVGDYTIVRELELSGPLGRDAFLAMKTGDPARLFVLKALTTGAAERNEQLRQLEEARQLAHPATVRVIQHLEHQGKLAVVFEHVDGQCLSHLLAKLNDAGERLTDPAGLHIAHQLMTALAEAHQAKDERGTTLALVHGHLGPDRIYVAADGRVRLFGLGLSSLFAADDRGGLATTYQPPEQRSRSTAPTPAGDVYSAAAIVWTLLTGSTLPLDGDVPPLGRLRSDLPRALTAPIDEALWPLVTRRTITARDVAEQLVSAKGDVADATELRWNLDLFRAASSLAPSREPPKGARMARDSIAPPALSDLILLSYPPPASAPATVRTGGATVAPAHDVTIRSAPPHTFSTQLIDGAKPGAADEAPRAVDDAIAPSRSGLGGTLIVDPSPPSWSDLEETNPVVAQQTAKYQPQSIPPAPLPEPSFDLPIRSSNTARIAIASAAIAAIIALVWVFRGSDDSEMVATESATEPATERAAPKETAATETASAGPPADASASYGAASVALANEASAAPSVSAAPPPPAELPPPPEITASELKELLSFEGYLVVRSSQKADVYVQGINLGSTNTKIRPRCWTRNVRLREPNEGVWLTRGQPVKITCMDATFVEIEPK